MPALRTHSTTSENVEAISRISLGEDYIIHLVVLDLGWRMTYHAATWGVGGSKGERGLRVRTPARCAIDALSEAGGCARLQATGKCRRM